MSTHKETLLHTVIQGPALLPVEAPPSAGLSKSSSFCPRMGKMVVDLTWEIFMGHVWQRSFLFWVPVTSQGKVGHQEGWEIVSLCIQDSKGDVDTSSWTEIPGNRKWGPPVASETHRAVTNDLTWRHNRLKRQAKAGRRGKQRCSFRTALESCVSAMALSPVCWSCKVGPYPLVPPSVLGLFLLGNPLAPLFFWFH